MVWSSRSTRAKTISWSMVVWCGVATLCALPASAQETTAPVTSNGFDAQTFWPAVGPYGVFSTEGSRTLDHLRPAFGLTLNYGAEPIIGTLDDGDTTAIISQQLAAHLQAGVGLTERLQVDLSMPLYAVNDGLFDGQEITGFTTGDLALRAKGALLSLDKSPVGVGLGLEARFPTGNEDAFTGGQGVVVSPRVLIDADIGPVYVATNLGARFQPERELRDLTIGHSMTYSVGAEWRVFDGTLGIGGELYGTTPFDQLFDERVSPLEGVLGVKLHTPAGFSVMSGAGGGIIGGVGAASFRSFIGLGYVKPLPVEEEIAIPVDIDEDGFPNESDGCPNEPEDVDGFEDEDGCPDLDNDKDGLADAEDECPLEAGDEAQKGCPIKDADADGVFDDKDQCIEQAGPAENEGCPWPDGDGDGVADRDDACIDVAGEVALKGCPRTVLKSVKVSSEGIEILDKIYFANGKDMILEKSFPVLDEVATVLREYPDLLKVEVGGHTDSKGSASKNKALSQRRADSVVAYLVGKQIDAARLSAVGYGEETPLVKEKNKDDRAKNRRVEFKVLERAQAEKQVEEGGTVTGGEEVIEDGGTVTGGEEVIEDGGTVTGGEEVIEEGGTVTGGEEVIEDGGTVTGGEEVE